MSFAPIRVNTTDLPQVRKEVTTFLVDHGLDIDQVHEVFVYPHGILLRRFELEEETGRPAIDHTGRPVTVTEFIDAQDLCAHAWAASTESNVEECPKCGSRRP
jgi:hypothetical protein